MYHSITFDEKNTWDDWHLVTQIPPSFNPPELKTRYVDIPGANGQLDLTESINGLRVYNNRVGELSFLALSGYMPWSRLQSEISNYLHGRALKAILEDDPDWYYEGRFTLNDFRLTNPWWTIVIGYTVFPFKLSVLSSLDDWLWDSFNFETGVIIPNKLFKNVRVDYSKTITINKAYIGTGPFSPEIIIDSDSGDGMRIIVSTNVTTVLSRALPDGATVLPQIPVSGTDVNISFEGYGFISIRFRRGSL